MNGVFTDTTRMYMSQREMLLKKKKSENCELPQQ